jgi:hypothetical protein
VLTISIVDAANSKITIVAISVNPIERNFIIMTQVDYRQI